MLEKFVFRVVGKMKRTMEMMLQLLHAKLMRKSDCTLNISMLLAEWRLWKVNILYVSRR